MSDFRERWFTSAHLFNSQNILHNWPSQRHARMVTNIPISRVALCSAANPDQAGRPYRSGSQNGGLRQRQIALVPAILGVFGVRSQHFTQDLAH
jgi:hypothetical protein